MKPCRVTDIMRSLMGRHRSGRRRALALTPLVAFLLVRADVPAAAADERVPAATWQWAVQSLLVSAYNPLVMAERAAVGAQHRLYWHPSPLLRDNYVWLDAAAMLSPIGARVGPSLTLQPVSVASFRISADWLGYWGLMGSLQSWPSPADDSSDSARTRRQNGGLNYATCGVRVGIEPVLQMRVPLGAHTPSSARFGFLAARARLAAEYWNLALHAEDSRPDTVWYEPGLDTLVSARGWTLQGDLDVLWQSGRGLSVGLHYTVVHPIYDRTAFRSAAEAESLANGNDNQRLGPIVIYALADHAGLLARPTLLLVANWYVSHRWRTGADIGAALPYVFAGLSFQLDLLQ